MKTFKQFVEQVTAQRALQRLKWMRKDVETHAIYDNPEHKPKVIKLPYSRGERHSSESFDRDDKNTEWHSRAGTERKYTSKKLSKLVSSASKLNFSQEWTDAHDETKLAHKSDPKRNKGHIVIATHIDDKGNDQHTVYDGHHALVGAIARGYDPTVKHVHLDKEANHLRKHHPEHEPKEDFY